MINQNDYNIHKNYKTILDYESKLASKMSIAVLEKPKLSAWMILLPIIIVPYMQRHQRYKYSTKLFVEDYLHTKKIALDAAYQLSQGEIPTEDARAMVKSQVEKNQISNPLVLNVYQKQLEEIDLLTSHHQTKEQYLSFIKNLTHTEKEVSEASSDLFVNEDGEAAAIAMKMEKSLLELRLEEANLLFTKADLPEE